MPGTIEEKTLMQSLLDCFSSSKTVIKYVVEKETDGRKKYEIPLNNVEEWWKLLFSKNIVALSIGPRSQTKTLSRDALSAFVRHVVNDKNKSILEKNLVPHFRGPHCRELISGEVSHLEQTIDLGVRAAKSVWPPRSDTLPGERLKASDEVQIHYEDAIRFLMQLFCGAPYEILLARYAWFAACIRTSAPIVEHYTTHQVLSIFACALILCLNIEETADINTNIESYIRSVIPLPEEEAQPGGEAAPQGRAYAAERVGYGMVQPQKESPAAADMELTINRAAFKINHYEIRKNGKPLDENNENAKYITKEIIDAYLADVYNDILGISAQVWTAFNIEQKTQAILIAYRYEESCIHDLTLDPNNRL